MYLLSLTRRLGRFGTHRPDEWPVDLRCDLLTGEEGLVQVANSVRVVDHGHTVASTREVMLNRAVFRAFTNAKK